MCLWHIKRAVVNATRDAELAARGRRLLLGFRAILAPPILILKKAVIGATRRRAENTWRKRVRYTSLHSAIRRYIANIIRDIRYKNSSITRDVHWTTRRDLSPFLDPTRGTVSPPNCERSRVLPFFAGNWNHTCSVCNCCHAHLWFRTNLCVINVIK